MSNSSSTKLGGQCLVVGGIISFIIFIIQILIGGPPPGNEHIFSYFANETVGRVRQRLYILSCGRLLTY